MEVQLVWAHRGQELLQGVELALLVAQPLCPPFELAIVTLPDIAAALLFYPVSFATSLLSMASIRSYCPKVGF